MSNTFMTSPSLLFSSESVTEGHPDKICDQISDAVLDWCLTQTPGARVPARPASKSDEADDWVAVFGEVTPLPRACRARSGPQDVGRDRLHPALVRTSGKTPHRGPSLGQSGRHRARRRPGLEAKQHESEDDLDTALATRA